MKNACVILYYTKSRIGRESVMLAEICNILELTTIIICNFLVKKYVFLEPELEAKNSVSFIC
jgi:hypothetical protein